jgi:hypothetical protein
MFTLMGPGQDAPRTVTNEYALAIDKPPPNVFSVAKIS